MEGRTDSSFKAADRARGAAARHRIVSHLAGALMATTALGGAAVWTAPALAQTLPAAQAPLPFALPAQPLPAAIDAFVRQTGWQIGYSSALAAGRTSRPVNGTMTPAQALDALLSGTGVGYTLSGSGTGTLVPAPAAAVGGPAVLAPVSVTANANIGDGSGRMTITREDLERKNPTDLRDVFSGEPTLRVGSSLPASQKVYVNGVEETNLAVTIDGSRQNNKVFHHNATTLIDPSLLKVVRVDAGVAPADAGPGALAGSIAYETKDAGDFLPGDGFGGFGKTMFNTNSSTLTTNVAGYGRRQGLEALGALTYGKGGRYTAGNGDKVDGTRTDVTSGLGKLAYQTDAGHRFQASYERIYDDAPRPFRANVGFISGRPAWEPRVRDYTLDRQNLVFTYTDALPTELWNPKLVIAYGRTDVETPIFTRPVGSSTVPGQYPGKGATSSFNGKFENTFGFRMGAVTVGTDFYVDRANYRDQTMTATERARNNGLYGQARLEPFERLRLSFGVRGDRQVFEGTTGEDWTNSGLSSNVSGEFDLLPEHLIAKAGYSRGWGGVQLAENYIMNPAWRYGAGPRAVSAENGTAGLEARYQGFTAEGRVFRTTLDDARAPRFAAASAALARDVKSKGYELGLGYAWTGGYVRAKYADIDVTIDGLPADSDSGTYLATPIGEVFTIGAAHTVEPWNVTFGGDVEVVLDYDKVQPGQRKLEGYNTVNLFAEHRLPQYANLALRVDVRNLFDQTYADRATYGQEFGTVTPLYQPGRTFLLTASAKF
ncbi:TonB-dependent receptor (plasmid) [Azospirillum brasilense]|uniref:TonB-dependent receptor n=1 Tax=Azospirillum brasilense TaxID=192 RepID=A0A4D8R5Y9_AZOBR|nr:TonB-dependent receptor [Azospirillum brasilense]OPH21454.1 TonB-dependent receptor [Azospirillum brasilense]QCO12712.1 TonB-dependent receptor [Azospirillum brasilense]QEL93910.1 TonB-dependent receptor [Azospirillum brasilense]QEM00216.1 TonB-dependent receptor [Azospirillum brasilense]